MLIKIKTDMVVGTATQRKWSQVVKVVVPDGEIYVVVSVVYGGEGDVLEVAEVGGGIIETLKSVVGVGKWELAAAKEKVAEMWRGVGSELELSVMVAKIEKENARLMVVGKGKVKMYLTRDGQTANLLGGEDEVMGIQGKVKEGDRFWLCTERLVEVFGLKKLEEVIGSDETLEQLAVQMHGQEDSSMLALIRGEVGEKAKEQGKVINGVVENVWKKIGGLGKRPILIKKEQKKHNIWIGGVLMLLLIIGVGIGVVKRQKTLKEYKYRQVETVVESKLREAKSIADLNPERAKGLLDEARREVESYLQGQEEGNYYTLAVGLVEQLERDEQVLFRQEEVVMNILVEKEVLDLAQVGAMIVDGTNIVLIEESGEKLVGISTKDKSSWENEISEVGEIKGAGVFGNDFYLLSREGVNKVSLEGGKGEMVIEPDKLWGEVSEIALFAGNAYILDTGQGEIWKYPALTEGFGARRRWLGAGILLDLSRVVDMEVDGDIWIVTSTGKLERYSRGVPVSFSMEGFPAVETGKLRDPRAVSTTEERVYVLESGAGRVVVFSRETGRYEKQLVNEELKKGEEMVVVDDKGYVLMPDRIVWFEL